MPASTLVPGYPPPALLERGLDLLFPPVCVGCRRVGRWICPRCWPRVRWIAERSCLRCKAPSSDAICLGCAGASSSCQSVVAVAVFEGVGREAVHALKYQGRHAIAGMMGKLMAQAAAGLEFDLIVPVPLHRTRMRERGYDQAALLARTVAQRLQRTYQREALERIRPTLQQTTLKAEARRANVAGAFQSTRQLEGDAILLVDDVSTTGATLDAAATALKAAGAGRVVGLVFAQAF